MQLVVPSLLVGLGFVGLESDWLKYQNHEIRDELQENIDRRFTLDDFSQYIPTVNLYITNLFGITGKHDVLEKTQLLCTAYLLMEVSVNSIKYLTKVERPDGSSRNSFPSGHTAAAFVGAELLRRKYGHRSSLVSIAGYAIAAGAVFFRMYNNRHWFTDVIAGADIGILSVEAAYWLYPAISRSIFSEKQAKNVHLLPYATDGDKGMMCIIRF